MVLVFCMLLSVQVCGDHTGACRGIIESWTSAAHLEPSSPCLPQRYQHIYLGALYGLLVVKAVLVDDFKALADGAIGPLRLARMTHREAAVFWGCKALYIAYFMALPALRSQHSLGALAALWLISEVVAGWMFAFLFQVNELFQLLPPSPESVAYQDKACTLP